MFCENIVIALVDCGIGNVRSVENALIAIGAPVAVARRPEDLRGADRIVLPGVGAFGEAVGRLSALGFVDALLEEVFGKGKPFLGICLGMQVLVEHGHEHGEHAGLGWIGGEVRRIEPAGGLPVPHVGWNTVMPSSGSTLLREKADFYFAHSYALRPVDQSDVAGTCDYGGEVVAMIERGHIFGTQFHPEKSQRAGLALFKNFLAYRC